MNVKPASEDGRKMTDTTQAAIQPRVDPILRIKIRRSDFNVDLVENNDDNSIKQQSTSKNKTIIIQQCAYIKVYTNIPVL
jgi:hypothetical protein